MGSLIPPELTLDCSLSSETWVPKTTAEFLAEVSRIQSASEKVLKLDRYVSRLQDEMKKIDAFKRELPLCMLLLNDAIATVKEELTQCKKSNAEPVLEEFMPLKKSSAGEEKEEKIESGKEKDIVNSSEKMNWMSSVQLWNSDNNYNLSDPKLDCNKKRKEEVINRPAMDDLFPSCKNRVTGRAFAPFKGCANFPVVPMGKEGRDELPGAPSLSLRTPEINNSKDEIYCSGLSSKSSSSRSGSSSATNGQSNLKTAHQQTARKQRRCWSPELHRRFVNALQHLGGAQAATPKQIRELMQVDGLTNDEVKSHLQKYRLHTRKVPPTTNTSTNRPVLLGGLWIPKNNVVNPQSRAIPRQAHLRARFTYRDRRGERRSPEAIAWKTKTTKDQRAAITCPGEMMYRLVHHELFADTEKVMIHGRTSDHNKHYYTVT